MPCRTETEPIEDGGRGEVVLATPRDHVAFVRQAGIHVGGAPSVPPFFVSALIISNHRHETPATRRTEPRHERTQGREETQRRGHKPRSHRGRVGRNLADPACFAAFDASTLV